MTHYYDSSPLVDPDGGAADSVTESVATHQCHLGVGSKMPHYAAVCTFR